MVAIVTARGGSKRIPKKNIKDFFGKPIISYSIEAALNSQLFDRVMVSTDSEEIKEVAIKYGAEVPFMRSEKTSNDFATTRDVLIEVIEEYKKVGVEFDEFACIYPTAPFLTSSLLIDAYKKFKSEDANALIPVVKFSFPPQRAFIIENGYINLFDEASFEKRSQDLMPLYHDVGQFYFYKTKVYFNGNNGLIDKSTYYELDDLHVQDIDNIGDWELAELKYVKLNGANNEHRVC